ENLPVTGGDRFSTTHDSMTMKRIGVSQEWLSAEKRSARQAAADAVVARESVNPRAAAAEVRLQTALAYVDAWFADEVLKLTTLMEHHAHEELEAAKGRLASSTASSQEVLAVTGARAMAEDESAEVRQAQATARVALQRWAGVEADELATPIVLPRGSAEAFVSAHPTVLAAQRELELAQREATLASANRRPNWTWEVS